MTEVWSKRRVLPFIFIVKCFYEISADKSFNLSIRKQSGARQLEMDNESLSGLIAY